MSRRCRLTHHSASCAQLPQATNVTLWATICSAQSQGRRANSLRSNKRGSVGPLRAPQTLRFPCFKAAADERKTGCGGSGCGLGGRVYFWTFGIWVNEIEQVIEPLAEFITAAVRIHLSA